MNFVLFNVKGKSNAMRDANREFGDWRFYRDFIGNRVTTNQLIAVASEIIETGHVTLMDTQRAIDFSRFPVPIRM